MKQVYQLSTLTIILLSLLGCQKDLSYEPALGSLDKLNNNFTSVKILGSYNIKSKLTSANYILAPVNVFVPGPYHIKTDTLNGYSFAAEGVFTHTGKDTIKLIGNGTPIGASLNYFSVSFDTSQSYIFVKVNGVAKYKSVFTYNIDGVPTVCTNTNVSVQIYAIPHLISIAGATTNSTLDLILQNSYGVIEPGIYNCLKANRMYGQIGYVNDQSFSAWIGGTDYADSSILISIDQISTTHVSGTFNGLLKSNNGRGTDVKNISNGVFDLPIY